MNCALAFLLVIQIAAPPEVGSAPVTRNGGNVIHIATALEHLTVLEFPEPVNMAATGSTAFQIERHENKVFIKPLRAGSSSDLFIWTATERFLYELDSPGEVKDMDFALDPGRRSISPKVDNALQNQELSKNLLGQALLRAEPVRNAYIKDAVGRVSVRVQQVYQAERSLYIRYAVRNLTSGSYRIVAPAVAELLPARSQISLVGLKDTQLDAGMLHKLGSRQHRALAVAESEIQHADLQPGEEGSGIVVIHQQITTPAVLELQFGAEGNHLVEAVVVF